MTQKNWGIDMDIVVKEHTNMELRDVKENINIVVEPVYNTNEYELFGNLLNAISEPLYCNKKFQLIKEQPKLPTTRYIMTAVVEGKRKWVIVAHLNYSPKFHLNGDYWLNPFIKKYKWDFDRAVSFAKQNLRSRTEFDYSDNEFKFVADDVYGYWNEYFVNKSEENKYRRSDTATQLELQFVDVAGIDPSGSITVPLSYLNEHYPKGGYEIVSYL